MWNRYHIVSLRSLFSTVLVYNVCNVYIIVCGRIWSYFNFPWNSQGIASLFTTGTFPGFGHVTSQMSHSQWSSRKEGTCPNWELVLCTLNKKLHMFLNSMVQKKKLTANSNPNPHAIWPKPYLLLKILKSRHHRSGCSMATVAGCKSLLLGLAYKTISLEFRVWIYYKTSTGAFPPIFFL